MKRAILMLAVLSVGGMASAALVVHADAVPIVYLGQNYNQVTVWVEGTKLSSNPDVFDQMGGFDGRFDGPMNQVWLFGGFLETPANPTVGDPTVNPGVLSAAQNAADSHLLFTPTVVTNAPHEDKNATGTGSWLANSATMNMAFGLEQTQRSSAFQLAQIVVPEGQLVRFVTDLASDLTGLKTHVDMTLPIPEPATVGLLAAGCIALIIRRRNRR